MLLVIDGNSIMNRAFYALPLNLSAGDIPTNAILGFMNIFYKAVDTYNPEYVLIAFDKSAPTFRHKEYKEYKDGRKKMPDELRVQFPVIKELFEKANIRYEELEGFEADDIIGTIVRKAENGGMDSIILTGDRDALQLISPKTKVLLAKKGVAYTQLTDEAVLMQEYGITPSQVIEMKALMGDSSDNIPGVPGVGEKTALKLLQEYGNVDELYKNVDSISGKLGEKLRDGKESAYMSRRLATICTESPIVSIPEECKYAPPAGEEIRNFYNKLGLRSLISRIVDAPGIQGSLFDALEEAQEVESKYEKLESIDQLKGEELAIYLGADTISLSCDGGSVYVADREKEKAEIIGLLRAKKVIAHDAKAIMHSLEIEDMDICFDTMVAEYLIDANASRYDIERLLAKYSLSSEVCAGGVYNLYKRQLEQLEKSGMTELLFDMELPLVKVLYKMECEGFTIDRDELLRLQVEFGSVLEQLEKEIYELAEGSFNINSPKQLGDVLFNRLGLPAVRKTKTGYSTDSEVLEKLADKHPIINKIIEYRSYTKLKGTYVDGMLNMTENSNVIHSRFNQTVASTGRISSTEPNLQNIPVRTSLGRRIRSVFVPRSEEHLLLDADYSQIELRVLAHMANDEDMINAFIEGEDIHASTAAQVFGVPLAQVSAEQRSYAKAVNFGVVYGISDFGLAKNLNISRPMAHDFIESYFAKYPRIKAYMDGLKASAHENGYACTLLGRRRDIPELRASNKNVQMAGERMAMNMPIQGTAADIIKMAMVEISSALEQGGFKSKLILQVHDELIIDAHCTEIEQVEEILRSKMENIVKLAVPLKVEIAKGRSWFETK